MRVLSQDTEAGGIGGGAPSFSTLSDTGGVVGPPSDKSIRWDDAIQADSGKLFVDSTDKDGIDQHQQNLEYPKNGDIINIRVLADSSIYQKWEISSIIDQTTYVEYNVVLLEDNGGNIANLTEIVFGFDNISDDNPVTNIIRVSTNDSDSNDTRGSNSVYSTRVPWKTYKAALAAASSGDLIDVETGTYPESNFVPKNLVNTVLAPGVVLGQTEATDHVWDVGSGVTAKIDGFGELVGKATTAGKAFFNITMGGSLQIEGRRLTVGDGSLFCIMADNSSANNLDIQMAQLSTIDNTGTTEACDFSQGNFRFIGDIDYIGAGTFIDSNADTPDFGDVIIKGKFTANSIGAGRSVFLSSNTMSAASPFNIFYEGTLETTGGFFGGNEADITILNSLITTNSTNLGIGLSKGSLIIQSSRIINNGANVLSFTSALASDLQVSCRNSTFQTSGHSSDGDSSSAVVFVFGTSSGNRFEFKNCSLISGAAPGGVAPAGFNRFGDAGFEIEVDGCNSVDENGDELLVIGDGLINTVVGAVNSPTGIPRAVDWTFDPDGTVYSPIINALFAVGSTQTSGVLIRGAVYEITTYVAGDDFVNVGGTNVTGNKFKATGTTPTDYTNASTLTLLHNGAIDIPSGFHYFPDENWEIITTELTGAETVQGTYRAGNVDEADVGGDAEFFFAAAAGVNLDAEFGRDFKPLANDDGVTSLSVGVTVVSDAATSKTVRFKNSGVLVKDDS